MRFLVLASDYDGTLAHHGGVDKKTIEAVHRLRESGRKLVLVTGRELDELLEVFPEIELCEWVVAENGALLYHPESKEEKRLAEPPPEAFVKELKKRGVERISCGRVIVATWEPHENTVLDVVRDMGLELQVIFNKGAVMILPTGVNKATGLAAALAEMKLSAHNVAAIGDAENDHALLNLCACGAATENALPQLKERADVVSLGDHGKGVAEMIDQMIEDDLAALAKTITRHDVALGKLGEEEYARVAAHGSNVLIAGGSGGGKSTIAVGFMERLIEAGYQICVVDPEGDYESFSGAVVFGDAKNPPNIDDVLQLLEAPNQSAIVNLVALDVIGRPKVYMALIARLQDLRTRTARPHWIITDEAHHVLPSNEPARPQTLPRKLSNMAFITVEPPSITEEVLKEIDVLVAVGEKAGETLQSFAKAVGEKAPSKKKWELEPGVAVVWNRGAGEKPVQMEVMASKSHHRRHRRKYAQGDLGEDRAFYFTGPEDAMKLKAQNLMIFAQLAEGLDDLTWNFHFERGDFSRWFREGIKDDELATAAEAIEKKAKIKTADSRAQIIEAIKSRYTAPAAPSPASKTK